MRSAGITNNTTNLYETFFKNSFIGMVVVDKTGSIISSNLFLQQLFGYTEQELIGKKIEILIPSRFHHNHKNVRNHFMESPHSRPMGTGLDLFGMKKDGTEFPIEVSLNSNIVNDENYVIAYVNDISKRVYESQKIEKLKEDLEINVVNRTRELTRTLSVMELLNEKLEQTLINQKAILDNAGVMLYATNKDGIIQFFNPEAVRLTGYQESEVVDKLSSVIFHRQLELNMCREQLLQKNITAETDFEVVKQKSLLNEIVGLECMFVNKNEEEIPVSLTMTPIWDAKNQLNGFMGVAFDMTENKRIRAELIDALSKEKQLGEMKSRFVSMASHEFRTPLSTILSSAYLAEKYTDTLEQPKREKHLKRIVNAVNNLTNILNEFLSVGKIEEGKVILHHSCFNLKDVFQYLINDVSGLLKKGQKIKYHHEGEEIVCLDSSLLNNIILNLLSNAIKFSEEGKDIEFYSEIKNEQVTISIKDHGLGIPEEEQQHLMQRFYRAKNVSNIQGTGLGLHIVSKYVELMGGSISFQSEENKGTTFIIQLTSKKTEDNEKDSID